jgi:S1-C subfamily serine protease
MSRKEFISVIILSSLISAALVLVITQWPHPPAVEAEFNPPGKSFIENSLTKEEEINIQIYQEYSKAVVNVTSTTLERGFWLQVIPRKGTGSGFFVDSSGLILTNHHVIENSEKVEVTFSDETTVKAEVIGQDPINDIALLKIDCPDNKCTPLRLAENKELMVGQGVLAIGNPFGLQGTMTSGIISSLGRSIDTEYGVMEELIQTDAAINPGNSGGPLLNTSGEVIGINTAILSRSGESAGIGLAVNATTINRVLPDLLEHGQVIRAWIGIRGRALNARLAEYLDLPVEEGLLVERVSEGSSADLAGLRGGNRRVFAGNVAIIVGGDVLVSMDGEPVIRYRDVLRLKEGKKPGQKIEFVFYRDNERMVKTVELVGEGSSSRSFKF